MIKKRLLFRTEATFLNTGYANYLRELLTELNKNPELIIGEMASYSHPQQHAQQIAATPWKIYPVLPTSPEEEQYYNNNPTSEFGSARLEQTCLDFFPHAFLDISDAWMCLTKRTLIQTFDGIKEVQDIKIGDLVLTHKGRYRKVTNVFERLHKGNFVTIKTTNNNYKLELTDNHPVLSLTSKKFPRSCSTQNYIYKTNKKLSEINIDSEWIQSRDLLPGDLVCFPQQEENDDFKCNIDLARLIGYYAAEGCILYEGRKINNHPKGIQLVFHRKEEDFIKDTIDIINKYFSGTVSFKYKGPNKNAAQIRAYSSELANFMISIIPGLSGTKKFKGNIINSNLKIQRSILTGLFRGDGGYDDHRGYYCTKSRDLAYQVFQMCVNNNILPSMGYNKNFIKNKIFFRYMFNFSTNSYINFKKLYTNSNNIIDERRIQNGYAFLAIKEIIKENKEEVVYNFEVEEDNSYVSSIVLHNCMYVDQTPFRRFFKTILMPTVDACFIAGTPVICENNVKNIEDIKENDVIVSHDGSYNIVKNTYQRNYNGELITLNCSGPALPITLTPEHPVFTIKYKGQKWTHDNRLHRSINHSYIDGEFISAKDLEPGDYLIVPNTKTFQNKIDIDITDYLGDTPYFYNGKELIAQVNIRSVKMSKNIILNEELAAFLGLFVAEGYIRDDNLSGQISMCKSKEQYYLDFAQEFITKNFNIKNRRYPHKIDDSEILSFTGKLFCSFLRNSCGHNAHTKKIPDFIFQSNKKIVIAFLEKMFVGDGCDKNRVISYATVSRTLALQTTRLLLQLGILSSLSRSKERAGNKFTYTIVILNNNGQKLANLFDWQNDNFNFSNFDNSKSWIDKNSGHGIVRLKSITRFKPDNELQVFNFQVENKGSYCVGFGVHNCNQNTEWLDFYKKSDYILTYTDWAKTILDKEGGNLINTVGVGGYAVRPEIYRFEKNKREHKEKMGIRPDSFIIGMVARNQKRKLYPEFAKSFVEFLTLLDQEETKNVFLYWHTSYPDLGWVLPSIILNSGLSHKILFTYSCMNCRYSFPSFYKDARTICPRCHTGSAILSNSQQGATEEDMVNIYNCFDLYAQIISNEGFGLSHVEAAMCGVPVCGTDYTATSEINKKLNGYNIPVEKYWTEAETGRTMAYPSNKALAEYIKKFVSLPESVRNAKRLETRQLAEKHYGSWAAVANNWMKAIDQVQPDDNIWASPPQIINIPQNMPDECNRMSDEQYVGWVLTNCLGEPRLVNSYIGLKMYRDLVWGRNQTANLGLYANEASLLGSRPCYKSFNRNDLYQYIKSWRDNINRWESIRFDKIQSMQRNK